MDVTSCPDGLFTDNLVEAGAKCGSEKAVWLALVSVLLICYGFTCVQAFVKWRRKNVGRSRLRVAGRPRDEYCFQRRLPILPTLMASLFISSVLFWSMATANVINFQNGASIALFAIHIFLAFIGMQMHLLRFVRLKNRLHPVASRTSNDSDPRRDSLSEDKSKNSQVSALLAGSFLCSLCGLCFGVIGGPSASEKGWIVSACGFAFSMAGVSLLVTFALQIHRTIETVEKFKTLSITTSRHVELNKMIIVLRRHRSLATIVLSILAVVSMILATLKNRPWFLLYICDATIIGHTLLMWLDELLFVKHRGRSRTLTGAPSPRLGYSPRTVQRPVRRVSLLTNLKSNKPQKEPELVVHKSTPSPKSKIAPYGNNGEQNNLEDEVRQGSAQRLPSSPQVKYIAELPAVDSPGANRISLRNDN